MLLRCFFEMFIGPGMKLRTSLPLYPCLIWGPIYEIRHSPSLEHAANPATNFSPTSNGLLNFSPSAIFHHSVRLKFESTDVIYMAWSSMLSSDATYVPGLLMSKKLQKVTLTGLGTLAKLPLDARRPIIQAAAS